MLSCRHRRDRGRDDFAPVGGQGEVVEDDGAAVAGDRDVPELDSGSGAGWSWGLLVVGVAQTADGRLGRSGSEGGWSFVGAGEDGGGDTERCGHADAGR